MYAKFNNQLNISIRNFQNKTEKKIFLAALRK